MANFKYKIPFNNNSAPANSQEQRVSTKLAYLTHVPNCSAYSLPVDEKIGHNRPLPLKIVKNPGQIISIPFNSDNFRWYDNVW
jgi:hypothetical protein